MFLTFLYNNNNNNNKKDKVDGGALEIQITDKWVIFVIYKELLQVYKTPNNLGKMNKECEQIFDRRNSDGH